MTVITQLTLACYSSRRFEPAAPSIELCKAAATHFVSLGLETNICRSQTALSGISLARKKVMILQVYYTEQMKPSSCCVTICDMADHSHPPSVVPGREWQSRALGGEYKLVVRTYLATVDRIRSCSTTPKPPAHSIRIVLSWRIYQCDKTTALKWTRK